MEERMKTTIMGYIRFWFQGLAFRVKGLGQAFTVSCLGFRVEGSILNCHRAVSTTTGNPDA